MSLDGGGGGVGRKGKESRRKTTTRDCETEGGPPHGVAKRTARHRVRGGGGPPSSPVFRHSPQDGINHGKGPPHAEPRDGPTHVQLAVGAGPVGQKAGALADPDRPSEEDGPVARVGQESHQKGRGRPEEEEGQGDVPPQLAVPLLVVQAEVFGDRGQVRRHEVLVGKQEDCGEGEQEQRPPSLTR